MITIFKNITDSKTPHLIEIDKVFERIKTGKSQELIEKIRSIQEKKERDKIKTQLPSICFSGEFTKRANDSCVKHSGYVCIDFDHVENIQELKTSLEWDKYTFAFFTSPSGDGLKVIVKIPDNISTHKASCRALKQYFNNPFLDNFEDIARVCYESYDPYIFLNLESEIFTDLVEEKIIETKVKENLSDDFEIFERLQKWIEQTDHYTEGNRHKFLVKFAGALNRYGVNLNNALSYLKVAYKNKSGKQDNEGFEKAITDTYKTYPQHHNISYFDKIGVSIERKTGQRTSDDVFKIKEITPETEDKIKLLAQKTMIDFNRPPRQMPVYLAIKKSKNEQRLVRLMTAGNISVIKGKAKSKKTFLLSMLTACLVSNNSIASLLYPSIPNEKRSVIFIDTEQSEYDSWCVTVRIKTMSGVDCENFVPFSMIGQENTDIIEVIKYLIINFPNISVIIIDQIADLVESVNDEKEAVKLVRFLQKVNKDYDIHICCVIHENPSTQSDKATGWIGSQILKKAETIMTVSKDSYNNRIAHVSASFTRGEEFDDFSFEINQYGIPEIITDFVPESNCI